MSPRLAIRLAADQTQRVNSIAADFSASAGAGKTLTGTMQVQLKPSLLADANLQVLADGQSFAIDEILSSKAAYVKSTLLSPLTTPTGKPWVEFPFSEFPRNLTALFSNLLQSAQNGNPLTQIKLLAAAASVHAAGTQVIHGVPTTHYTGSLTPSAALSALPSSLRTELGPPLRSITGVIRFDIWIDAQHLPRKISETETVGGQTVNLMVDVTAVNQPVNVALPPASQVTILPKSVLGGA